MNKAMLLIKDISYGAHERQKLDIFVPENIRCDNGILLFIHGGGWSSGDKSVHYPDAEFICKQGFCCVTMNYRYVSENISVFDELDDITSALNAIKEKCTQYGIYAQKVILSGGSAGAHLALMYSYTRQDEAPIKTVAACVWCPPVNCAASDFLLGVSEEFEEWKYDILSKCSKIKITKNNFYKADVQKALKMISPQEYVSENCVPTAVFHGKNDELVPLEHIDKFIALLNKNGIKNDFLLYENSGHALDKDSEKAIQAKNIIKDYLTMYL